MDRRATEGRISVCLVDDSVRIKSILADFARHFSLHIHLIDAFEALFIIKNRTELTMRVIKRFRNGHAMRVPFTVFFLFSYAMNMGYDYAALVLDHQLNLMLVVFLSM